MSIVQFMNGLNILCSFFLFLRFNILFILFFFYLQLYFIHLHCCIIFYCVTVTIYCGLFPFLDNYEQCWILLYICLGYLYLLLYICMYFCRFCFQECNSCKQGSISWTLLNSLKPIFIEIYNLYTTSNATSSRCWLFSPNFGWSEF